MLYPVELQAHEPKTGNSISYPVTERKGVSEKSQKNTESPRIIRYAMRQSFTTNVVPTPGRDVHVTLPP